MVAPSTAAVRFLSGEREPVRAATILNIALDGLQTIDGVSLTPGDRVLVKNQTDARQNGIYAASAGLWQRASDASFSRALAKSVSVKCQEGTENAGTMWVFGTSRPAIGRDDILVGPLLLGGGGGGIGYTPENAAKRGQPNGYASLGSDGKVPRSQLPADSGGGSGGGGGAVDADDVSETSSRVFVSPAERAEIATLRQDLEADYQPIAAKGAPGGYASLDQSGKVPAAQLPSGGGGGGSSDAKDISYFPAPSIAVPVAQRLGQEVSLLDGWVSGVTDFSDLMDANLARSMATKRPLIIPADEFFVKRQFLATNESLSIFGYGKSKSVLTWAADAASLGMEFSFNNERHSVTMEDFGLWTQVRDVGKALKLDFANTVDQNGGNPVVAGRFFQKVQIRGLLIGGRGNTPNNGFRHGIDCNIANAVNIEGCSFLGGIQGADPNYIAGTAIRIGAPDPTGYGHPTVHKVRHCYFQHWQAGIIFEGTEGAYAHENDIVGAKIGIWFKDAYGRPQFNVGDNHINCSQVGIWAQGSGEHNLKGNLIYNVIGNSAPCTGILVNGNFSVGGVITGNNFANTSTDANSPMNSIIIEAGRDITIDHNVFRKNGPGPINGVWLAGGSKRCVVGDGNIFENETFGTVGYRVLDQGSENMQPGYGARFGKYNSQGSGGGLDIVTFDHLQELTGNPGDDMGDGAFVIPSDGVWCFTGGVAWADGGTALVTLNIQLNATSGAPICSQQARVEAGNSLALTVSSGPRPFRKNDVVRLGANSGGSGRTILGAASTFFEARRLA